MKLRRQQIEPRLQILAIVLLCAALIVGVASLGVRLVANAELRARLDERREEQRTLAAETASLESEVARRSARAQQGLKEVTEEINQRSQVKQTMAEVLARARLLGEERDTFEAAREQVRDHFKSLDDYYSRASRQAPGIEPK